MVATEGDFSDWALRGSVCADPGGTRDVELDFDNGMWPRAEWGLSEFCIFTVLALTTVLRLAQSVSMATAVSLEGEELMELMPLVVVSVLKL